MNTSSLSNGSDPLSFDGRLPAFLDLRAAEGLQAQLRSAIADGPVRLDGSAVERISTPCLQLLVAAAAAVRANGQPFALHDASPPLAAAIVDLGLTDFFAETL